MNNQTDEVRSPIDKWVKRSLIGTTVLATIIGTYSAREGDFAPVYVRHTGTSYGISVGIVQKFDEGVIHNGLVISGYTLNRGKINGAAVSLVSAGRGTINGLELGAFNIHSERKEGNEIGEHYGAINGLQLSLFNAIKEANGMQIGIFNGSNDGSKLQFGLFNNSDIYDAKTFQIGILNFLAESDKTNKLDLTSGGLLLNWDFRNEKLKEEDYR